MERSDRTAASNALRVCGSIRRPGMGMLSTPGSFSIEGLVGADDAVGHRLELAQIPVCARLDETGVEVGGGQIALLAGVVVNVVAGQLLVEAQIIRGLWYRHTEARGDVAAVDTPLPEQTKLYELKALLGAPAPLVIRVVHRPPRRSIYFLDQCCFYAHIVTICIKPRTSRLFFSRRSALAADGDTLFAVWVGPRPKQPPPWRHAALPAICRCSGSCLACASRRGKCVPWSASSPA